VREAEFALPSQAPVRENQRIHPTRTPIFDVIYWFVCRREFRRGDDAFRRGLHVRKRQFRKEFLERASGSIRLEAKWTRGKSDSNVDRV